MITLDYIKKQYGSGSGKHRNVYKRMYDYYKGKGAIDSTYKIMDDRYRSNLKIRVNFLKKFITEEVSYVVGNDITYESISGDFKLIDDVIRATVHWDELSDINVMKYMLIFSKAYELYYIKGDEFCSKIINPLNGYAHVVDNVVEFFVHRYRKGDVYYFDVYTDELIYHLNDRFEEYKDSTSHIFSNVPVSIGNLRDEGVSDTLFEDIRDLQDSYERNLSDIANEISDFRTAYLQFIGCNIDETGLKEMREKGILQSNNEKANISWLIKDVNDAFIQNTLDRYVDNIYQISCHINHNEAMQSNVSGVALRSRLIALENKCTLNEKSHKNMIKTRLKFLCEYLNLIKSTNYDYRDIKIIYTPNIPSDDLSTAQMLSQVPGGVISKDTARGLFSFITNKALEETKVSKEVDDQFGVDLNAIE